jgi:hypothetical protein
MATTIHRRSAANTKHQAPSTVAKKKHWLRAFIHGQQFMRTTAAATTDWQKHFAIPSHQLTTREKQGEGRETRGSTILGLQVSASTQGTASRTAGVPADTGYRTPERQVKRTANDMRQQRVLHSAHENALETHETHTTTHTRTHTTRRVDVVCLSGGWRRRSSPTRTQKSQHRKRRI